MNTKTAAQGVRQFAAELSAQFLYGHNQVSMWKQRLIDLANRIEREQAEHDADAERFRAIAEFDAVCINAWIVQARRGESWGTAYHKVPPAGVPKALFDGDKLAALRAAVDSARVK